MKQQNTRRGQTQTQCSVGQALPDNAPKGHLSLFTRPSSSRSVLMRDIGASHGIIPGHAGFTLSSTLRPWREKVAAGRMRGYSLGFTLIEILMVVLIIGILGAIMLPQYQRAVLKSRFAALMPIAKSMADSNEAYFLEHGVYAANAQDLPIQGRMNYQDGTQLEFGTSSDYSYVLATRGQDFPNNYIVYQKHSGQFAGEIHCEAATDNTQAQEVCKSFGATEDIGETLTPGYLTYVLFGTGNGVAPTGDNGENDEDDDTGDNNPGGTSGTNTEPEPTVTKMTAEEAQAFADTHCVFTQYGCTGIANNDGTVSVCEDRLATVKNGECVHTNQTWQGNFETVYNADGTKARLYNCTPGCNYLGMTIYGENEQRVLIQARKCANGASVSKDLICPGGLYNTSSQYNNFDYDDETETWTYCTHFGPQGECNPSES